MKAFGICVKGLVAATGLLVAAQAGSVTVAGPGAVVNTVEVRDTVVDGIVTSIDVKRGILVTGGRTYGFDPKVVSFSDERREPSSAGLASLKPGSKVTLRMIEQDGTERLLQITARD